MHRITINGISTEADQDTTILAAATQMGIHIPTLCHLEGLTPTGACRVCVVEIEGAGHLAAACSTPVRDGMVIRTHSKRVREARTTVVELLLSEHEGDCQTCQRSSDCELRELARELRVLENRYTGEKPKTMIDDSTPALYRDSGKCIKCRRCVEVCTVMQHVGALFPQYRGFDTTIGPAFSSSLDLAVCVQCGQCAAVCPVGAIIEQSHIEQVLSALEDPNKQVIVQTAPAIRAALGECFDLPPGTLVTGRMVSALRRLGFDAVFDTNFTADLTIMEEGTELLMRLRDKLLLKLPQVPLPMFTSCSPGWIQFAEYYYPDLLENISTCKSPQQMFGAVAKTYYAQKLQIDPKDLVVVSIMPCTAKKYEAAREEMHSSGYRDVDYVLTTRELGDLIHLSGIDFIDLPDDTMDDPLGISTGAADIFANSGGVMEAALRTVYFITTGRSLPSRDLHIEPLAGMEGVKTVTVLLHDTVDAWKFLEGVQASVAVAHGLGNAAQLMDRITADPDEFLFVEIMSCPGGCIGGGGQPRFTTDSIRTARMAAIFAADEGKTLRESHTNPAVMRLYEEFLGSPLSSKSHHLLHTQYRKKQQG